MIAKEFAGYRRSGKRRLDTMKKILALAMALAMVLTLAACGGGGDTYKIGIC